MLKSIAIGLMSLALVGIMSCLFSCNNDDPASSNNTQSWVRRASGTDNHLCDVTWNGTKFIISGWDLILSSSDGIHWSEEELPPEYIAAGYSLDAVVWSEERQLFLVAGDNNIIMTSPDGSTWTMQESGLEHGYIQSAVVFDTLLLISVSNPVVLLTSGDGVSWTAHPDIGPFDKMASSDSLLIGVGNSQIYSSKDGIDWTLRHSGDSLVHCISRFETGGIWVAAGHLGYFLKSSNGIDWTGFDAGAGDMSTLLDAFSSGTCCTVVGHANGPGLILNSTDGESWSRTVIDSVGWLNGITASTSRTVVVGENGVILTKP